MNSEAISNFDEGVASYQAGLFLEAEDALKRGLAQDQMAWKMRFYLAMTYARLGKSREARLEFMSVRDFCPDPDMRNRATTAFTALTQWK